MTWFKNLGTGKKIALAGGILLVLAIILGVGFGSAGKNDAYQPQNEFMLDPWVSIKIGGLDLSLNKAVLYLLIAATLTCLTMRYIAKRMQERPNNVQTAVETAYDVAFNNITRGNMDPGMAAKWFPVVGTLFFFILFSNVIGYLPLPTNTEHKVDIFGAQIPTLALYAATANISVPLVLTLMVWSSYHIEGIRAKGLVPYFKSWVPAGVKGPAAVPIFAIEAISHFVRIISLSVRLFANILAGHLLILFMGGGMVILLGAAFIGPITVVVAVLFFLFELVIVAGLQAFIFATLTSIYLGSATGEAH
ncbi:MAG: F-type H+-transporting ATPase subunit a [Thermoleophilaceae bacterium]|nr:F-type H+-transporting ATPase subunit a [Thermoleophilaceae bacterium]